MADMPNKPSHRDSLAPTRGHLFLPVATGVVLVAYVAGMFLLPRELYFWRQLAVGLGFALLATLFFLAVTRRREPPEMLRQRVRLAQHSDFGKQLHTLPASRQWTIRLPWLGRVSLRSLGALAVFFAVVSGWCLSPWPIRVKSVVVEDMTVPLAEEIVSAVLVLPNPHMAVLQAPIVPPRAQQLAGMIPDTAGPGQLALRELGLGHFDQARTFLARARQAPAADAAQIGLIDAQLAMFAGRFAEAMTLYGQVAQQQPDDPMLWCQWAAALMQADQFAQAGPLVEQATRLCRQGPATPPGATAACLHLQALVALNRGRGFAAAEAALGESGKFWKQVAGGAPSCLAASQNNRAALYVLHGDYLGAKELLGDACDEWSRSLGEEDPYVAAACDNLAMLQRTLGRQSQAQKSLDQATKICETLAEDHPLRALNLAVAGAAKRERGRYAEARADAEQALVLAEKALGGEHPLVAAILDNLMDVDTDEARYAEAYSHGSRARSLIKQLWGADHPYLAMNLNGLAKVEIGEGQAALAQGQAETAEDHFSKADALCQEALRIVQQAFGPKSCWRAEVQYTRGRLEVARNAPQNAQPYFDEARKIWTTALGEALGDEYPPSIRVLGDLASLDDNPTLIGGAMTQAERAVELAERVYGSDHPESARLRCILAVLQRQKGDYAAAIESLDEALKIREHSLPASHPDLAATLEVYASVLRKMDPPQNDKAAEMEARAKKIRAAHAEEDRLK